MDTGHSPEAGPGIKIVEKFPHPHAQRYNEDLWYRQHGQDLVIINCQANQIRFPEHWTPLSVKCAFGGKEFYHFGNHSLAVQDANFLILNEGAVYASSIEGSSPTESFTLNFTETNIREVYAALNPGGPQLDNPFEQAGGSIRFMEQLYPHQSVFSRPIHQIRNLVRKKEPSHQPYLELMYMMLENMIQLNRQTSVEIDRVKAVKRSTREELYKRLNMARDYMESCFFEEITLHSLSRVCLLNPYYLLREFRKYFGITPHQYLMNCRLREAIRLLVHTNTEIGELGKAVGFQDQSSFSKLFKRRMGCSPDRYRKNLEAA